MGTAQYQTWSIDHGPTESAERQAALVRLFRTPPADGCKDLLPFNLIIGRASIRPARIPEHDYSDMFTTGLGGSGHVVPM